MNSVWTYTGIAGLWIQYQRLCLCGSRSVFGIRIPDPDPRGNKSKILLLFYNIFSSIFITKRYKIVELLRFFTLVLFCPLKLFFGYVVDQDSRTLWIRIRIEQKCWIRIEVNPDPQPWYIVPVSTGIVMSKYRYQLKWQHLLFLYSSSPGFWYLTIHLRVLSWVSDQISATWILKIL
jgi:hypothetical protein